MRNIEQSFYVPLKKHHPIKKQKEEEEDVEKKCSTRVIKVLLELK
jgi:hypothetical protein